MNDVVLEQRIFELTMLLFDTNSQECYSVFENYKKFIQEHGGRVKKVEFWGLRGLAYPINKHKKARYLNIIMEAPAKVPKLTEDKLRIDNKVIRSLVIKLKSYSANPSELLHNSNDETRLIVYDDAGEIVSDQNKFTHDSEYK